MPKDEDWLKEPPQTTNTYYFSQDGGVQDSPRTSFANSFMYPAATFATSSTETPCDSSSSADDMWTTPAAQSNPYETGDSSEQTPLYPAFNYSSYGRGASGSYSFQSNYTSFSAIFGSSSPALENSCPPPSTVTDTVTVTVNAEASAAASAFAEASQITPTVTITVTATVCNNMLPSNSGAGGDYSLPPYGTESNGGSPYETSEGEGLPSLTGGGQSGVEQFPTGEYPTGGGETYSAGGGNAFPTSGGEGYPTGAGQSYPTGGGEYPTGGGEYPTVGGEYPTVGGEVYPSGGGGPAYTTPPWDVGNNSMSQIAGSGSYSYGGGFPSVSATDGGGNWQATGVQVPPFPTAGGSWDTTSAGMDGGQSYEVPSYSMPPCNSSSQGQGYNVTAVPSNSLPGYEIPYPTTEAKTSQPPCPPGMSIGQPPTSEYTAPFETDGSLPTQDSGYPGSNTGSIDPEYPASHPFSAIPTNYPAESTFPQATDSSSNSSTSCDNSKTISTTIIQDVSFATPFSISLPSPHDI
ncbi:MAG: hypothetical protein Q9167_004453 [Letrouitia subvulpina]